MADFSELIVSLIIAAVIFVINSLGSKKGQQAKNQNTTTPSIDFEEAEEETNTETLTWDDIFKELRQAKAQREIPPTVRETDDYIPRSPKAQPQQPAFQSHPKQEKHQPLASIVSSQIEGQSAIKRTAPIASEEIGDLDDAPFDVNEVDWRQAVVATEILNRKY